MYVDRPADIRRLQAAETRRIRHYWLVVSVLSPYWIESGRRIITNWQFCEPYRECPWILYSLSYRLLIFWAGKDISTHSRHKRVFRLNNRMSVTTVVFGIMQVFNSGYMVRDTDAQPV